MRVIIIGAGEAGYDVARVLSSERHDVVVIDSNPQIVDEVRERLDVMAILGNATSADVLTQAQIKRADMVIALTAIDEVNLVACMMADRLGVRTTVARVRSNALSSSKPVLGAKDFGIELIIHPEESTASEIVRLIHRASATDLLTFCNERVHLVGMRIDADSEAIGKSLQELAGERADLTYRIMGIVRGIRTIVPRGNERIAKNDQVFVLAHPQVLPLVANMLGKKDRQIQSVMVLGGTYVGGRVAEQLGGEKGIRVKLIEPNKSRAERLAGELPGVMVIHGEATDIDLLVVEGLGEVDAFVAVTDDEESNLVSCLMAKHLGVRKTVALLSKPAYIPISQSIGLDAAVNKKLAVSREVLRFLRGKHVLSVASVYGLDAEVLEMEALPGSRVTKHSIKVLSLPRGILIGAIVRPDGAVEIATGDSQIEARDRAILFVLPHLISEADRYFGRK